MKKFLLSALFIIQCVTILYAVPAKPGISKVTQPDGSQLFTLQLGDETFHYRTTTDQYVLLQDAQGYWVYAQQDTNGELVISGIIAHNVNERNTQEMSFLKTIKPNLPFGEKVRKTVKSRLSKKTSLYNSNRMQRAKSATNTSPHYLVILVEFSDNSFAESDSLKRFQDQLNGTNYTTDGATGSAGKYFSDNSMGNFAPVFDVYGPVKLDSIMEYYGGNKANGDDLHPDIMVTEACQLLDNSVDFSIYDTDNDHLVDNVFVIYAGYGEASGGSENTIWPHAGGIYNNVKLDGMWLDRYGCTCELQSNGTIDGIGTMCHEFTHIIGLPDFYDTDYETNGYVYGTDAWDLMGGGNYNNDSKTPPYYTAIERQMMGWGTPTMIAAGNAYTLDPVNTNQFYRINTSTPDEYFLFENRQQSGWDSFIPGHGMLVYHVDQTSAYQSYWDSNTINAYAAHPCMEIVPAGGVLSYSSGSSQPFPGTNSINRITDTTNPNLKSWAGTDLGKALINITETSNQISFVMLNTADLLSVETAETTNVGSNSFTANWTAFNSTSTILNVYQKSATSTSTQDFETLPLSAPWEAGGDGIDAEPAKITFPTQSLYFGLTGDYLISAPYTDGINNISFKTRAWNGNTWTSTLELFGSTDKSTWESLKVTTPGPDVSNVVVPVDISKLYVYYKFVFTNTNTNSASGEGGVCIDDVTVTSGGVKTYAVSKRVSAKVASHDVTELTTYNVTGLSTGELYYYTLTATNDNESATTAEVPVQLTSTVTGNSIESKDKYKVISGDHIITIESPDNSTVKIFNAMGQLVKSEQLQIGTTQIPVSTSGIYIVKINNQVMKLIVK